MMKEILIIDDSVSIREILSIGLRNAGYKVITAMNGKEGLAQVKLNPDIKLVITDLNMPLMDGIEFLKAVRTDAMYAYLPVIIATTENQNAKKEEARTLGATGWIIKPFTIEKLLNVVKKIIS